MTTPYLRWKHCPGERCMPDCGSPGDAGYDACITARLNRVRTPRPLALKPNGRLETSACTPCGYSLWMVVPVVPCGVGYETQPTNLRFHAPGAEGWAGSVSLVIADGSWASSADGSLSRFRPIQGSGGNDVIATPIGVFSSIEMLDAVAVQYEMVMNQYKIERVKCSGYLTSYGESDSDEDIDISGTDLDIDAMTGHYGPLGGYGPANLDRPGLESVVRVWVDYNDVLRFYYSIDGEYGGEIPPDEPVSIHVPACSDWSWHCDSTANPEHTGWWSGGWEVETVGANCNEENFAAALRAFEHIPWDDCSALEAGVLLAQEMEE